MDRRAKLIIGALAVAVFAGGATTAAAAGGAAGGSSSDQPLQGQVLEQAVSAALAESGPGTVAETEAGDDGATYGVEIQLQGGGQVEVSLGADFSVLGSEADDDSGE